MFRFVESLLEPTGAPPEAAPPLIGTPHALWRFYWHFVRQIPGLLIGLFAVGLVVALLDAAVPVCIGWVVSMVSERRQETGRGRGDRTGRAITPALPRTLRTAAWVPGWPAARTVPAPGGGSCRRSGCATAAFTAKGGRLSCARRCWWRSALT